MGSCTRHPPRSVSGGPMWWSSRPHGRNSEPWSRSTSASTAGARWLSTAGGSSMRNASPRSPTSFTWGGATHPRTPRLRRDVGHHQREAGQLLTIFSTPKAFDGLFGLIQANAITSWTKLAPSPQIILFGDEPGTKDICNRLSLGHVTSVATSAFGTPLVSDMLEQAQSLALNPLVCFVNADIILTSESMSAARLVGEWSTRFLMVGERSDLDVRAPLDFESPEWESEIKQAVQRRGRRRSEVNVDWFVFPTGQLTDIPPFALGPLCFA